MRNHTYLTILVVLSLFLLPFSGTIPVAMAGDAGRLDQEVCDPDLIRPVLPGQHDGILAQSSMTGTDPNQSVVPGSRQIEVQLPAGPAPVEGTATAAGPDRMRHETTYPVKPTGNLIPGPDVLLVIADDDVGSISPAQLLLQAYGDLGSVDLFDAATGTPALAQLQGYDIVVTWSNHVYADPVAIGDVLADYVDAGGKVVNLMFSIGTHGWQMLGRFMTGNYTAMNGTGIVYSTDCLGDYDPSHPIMSGITDVCDYYRLSGTYLTPGSSSIAQWNDGLLFVAVKDNRSVVSIAGYIGYYYQWTGRMPDVVHNAILWLAGSYSCDTILWDNGPLVTHIGEGFNGANASALQQTGLGMNTYGFGAQVSYGYRMADDFVISNPEGWDIKHLIFYAYQTGTYTWPPASTITGIYYQIWNGPPNEPASSVIFGDLTTNRLIETSWIHTYRVQDTDMTNDQRPIMANVAGAGLHLPSGAYWLDWMIDGSGTSGPWAPPVTILGQTTTGNALQYTSAWAPAQDTGTGTQQGMPFLIKGCREEGAWVQINDNPVPLMDNVLAAYNGKLWSITGYGASSAASTFNPTSGSWTTVASSSPPFGVGYPRSGCQVGSKVYVYGDSTTSGFTGLWSYNMDINAWTQETPGGTPPAQTGIWAPSWVVDTATSRCYMTGGATAPGGGNLTTVYVYNAASNQWETPLPDFCSVRNFHGAYLFTRPSDSHQLLCVAGGVTSASVVLSSTQCYDFTTATWNTEDTDIEVLPFPWWGMGYTQSPTANGCQLWLVNGADDSFALHGQDWYYSVSLHRWVNTGPLESGQFFRTAAANLNGTVYHVGGSTGGFSPSGLSDKYQYTRRPVSLPFLLLLLGDD